MPRQKRQHLKRRKDGRYCAVFMGRQFMARTEDEALAMREEYKRQLQREGAIRENPTVSEYAALWLQDHRAGIREATHKRHEALLRKLCAEIGDLYVREVRPSDIKRVYSVHYAGVSDGHIKHGSALYRTVFESAVDDGIIQINPAKASSAKPHKGTRGSHRAITPEERLLIETVATDHRIYPAVMVMLYAGLRPQEVKALRVEDIDFDAGVIHVHSFVHKASGNQYSVDETGKTDKATRDVPLFAPVRQALQGKKGYLISAPDGGVASRTAWTDAWESYCHRIECHMNGMSTQKYTRMKDKPPWKRFTVVPYDLRHSFATWCRDHDVELHTCVQWMGHTDAQMILHIYDEVTDTRSKKEAERLEKMLNHMQTDMQTES